MFKRNSLTTLHILTSFYVERCKVLLVFVKQSGKRFQLRAQSNWCFVWFKIHTFLITQETFPKKQLWCWVDRVMKRGNVSFIK